MDKEEQRAYLLLAVTTVIGFFLAGAIGAFAAFVIAASACVDDTKEAK